MHYLLKNMENIHEKMNRLMKKKEKMLSVDSTY